MTCLLIIAGALYGQANTSTGTGFFISADGFIVTCAHVIEGAKSITVSVDGNAFNAKVVAKDTNTDMAILKINHSPSRYFRLASFSEASLGDKVFVLGFPLSHILGSDIRVTDGILSAKSGLQADPAYFQISAPIQPGNSGGPVINDRFEVLGIAAAKLDDMAAFAASGAIPQNVNFAIKNTHIASLLPNFSNNSGNVQSMNDAVRATVQITVENPPPAENPLIRIINNTGFTVLYMYVSPVTSRSWGRDVLGGDVLRSGASVLVRLPHPISSINRYDIMLKDSDGDTYTKMNVQISQNGSVNFTINDIDIDEPESSQARPSSAPAILQGNLIGYD